MPDPAQRARYDELFDTFLTIYKQTQKIYAGLNGGNSSS
jgi:hypothetical protein